jgi:hypothetical protein
VLQALVFSEGVRGWHAIVVAESATTAVVSLLVSVSVLKVKKSRNRPSVAQRVPGGLGSQIP